MSPEENLLSVSICKANTKQKQYMDFLSPSINQFHLI